MRIDKKRNKDRIIENALLLMTNSNPDTVSIDEIAKSSEVTRATLYNHFASKEDLLREMIMPALNFSISDMEKRNEQTENDFSELTSSLFELYLRHNKTLDLINCRSMIHDELVMKTHGQFMIQFKKLIKSTGEENYPLGLEMSIRIISQIYLPVLQEVFRGHSIEDSDLGLLKKQFHKILKGALCL